MPDENYPTAPLTIEQDIPSFVCDECGDEYIIFGVYRHEPEYPRDDPEVSCYEAPNVRRCPSCGALQSWWRDRIQANTKKAEKEVSDETA